MSADVQIATFERGARDKLVIAIREYNGARYVDVRVHFVADGDALKPTKKGATIKLRELRGVIEALERASAIVEGGRT